MLFEDHWCHHSLQEDGTLSPLFLTVHTHNRDNILVKVSFLLLNNVQSDHSKYLPIKSGGPSAQLIHYHKRVCRRIAQDCRSLIALHQKGAFSSNNPVTGT